MSWGWNLFSLLPSGKLKKFLVPEGQNKHKAYYTSSWFQNNRYMETILLLANTLGINQWARHCQNSSDYLDWQGTPEGQNICEASEALGKKI